MIAGLIARARSVWRGLRRRGDVEAEMTEEFRLHVELRTADLIRQGLRPEEAARQARIEFGHIQGHREDARDARGLRWFDELGFSWLDVKLGLRMMMKYPGLSLVAVIGMAVAIAIGVGGVGFINALAPTLPLDEGGRIVAVQNNDARNPSLPNRRSVHDFLLWREELTSVRDLSAFISDQRNLIIPGRGVELVPVAQMTASGFRVARVPPVLGRPLLEADEREGASPVVVIAYEDWQRRFDGDPGIVGRPVRLGGDVHIVVGVMPEGFRFPVNHHFWVPLRLHPTDYERGGGPAVFMFGRLADEATLEQAQAEITTIGRRMAATYPEASQHLRPQILPYTHPFVDIDTPETALAVQGIKLAVCLLLVLVAANVAILVYARTATRTGEIAVRTALGASRRRVVTQLFAEALALSGAAAALGLAVAGVGLAVTWDLVVRSGPEFPFWFHLGLSPGLAAYAAGLALLAGVIVGVAPALKATGRRVQAGLQQLSSRASGMRLGRMWTALIVAQVGIAVAILPYALLITWRSVSRAGADVGYAADEMLRANLSMQRDEAPPTPKAVAYARAFEARFRDRAAELLRRLIAEPAVAGATFAVHFPGTSGRSEQIEVEGSQDRSGALLNDVDVDLFTVFGVPILAGRTFDERDAREGSAAIIVNRAFVENALKGEPVLGRHIRLAPRAADAGPWLEIVGVVPDFPGRYHADAQLYRPVALARSPAVLTLVVRTRDGSPRGFAGRLRDITAAVDPTLQLHELQTAADAERDEQQTFFAMALLIVAVTGSVLLLSAAGIYAMMSFTVAKRRREIGIRSALGADPRQILRGVFARAASQLGAGVLVGLLLATAAGRAVSGGPWSVQGVALLLAVAAIMLAIGLLAALGPARQGLSIQPTEALKEE